jgi:acetyl esterase/lipase
MKKIKSIILVGMLLMMVVGCEHSNTNSEGRNHMNTFTKNTKVYDVINNTSFKGYGKLIFPVDRKIDKNMTLDESKSLYIWYNYINSNKTVEIVNYMKQQAGSKKQIFYNIYTEEEMRADPEKRNTGLFYFRGKENAKFAILNAGGGFMYVGAMQDSFPHALELSKKGYNAFALIYRPDANKAMEDLARAVAFIHENKNQLKIDVTSYSVWGGSAGGRMAAWLGDYGTESFGEKAYPRPSTVIMQYTGLSEVTGNEPPTYACVGTADYIADDQVMENRINKIKSNGTDAQIEKFKGLPHGFGLGEGTKAEGWINHAIQFWEKHMN